MTDNKRCWNCAHFERDISPYYLRECRNPAQPLNSLNDYGNNWMLAKHALDGGFCGPDRVAWAPRNVGPVARFFDRTVFGLHNAR